MGINQIQIWDPLSISTLKILGTRTIKQAEIEEFEKLVESLTTQTINYLKSRKLNKEVLRIELDINSGGKGGSIFNAAKIEDKVYLIIKRKIDNSANTVVIRWIDLQTPKFEILLEDSIKKILTSDAFELKRRSYLRDDFLKSMKILSN